MSEYILALDQGTTSSRAIVFSQTGHAVASSQQEFPQLFPSSGHVEHNPEDIWDSQLSTARAALASAGLTGLTSPASALPISARQPCCGNAKPENRSPTQSSGKAVSQLHSVNSLRPPGTRTLYGTKRDWFWMPTSRGQRYVTFWIPLTDCSNGQNGGKSCLEPWIHF